MVTFIETSRFSRLVGEYLSDEEYARLQQRLMDDPGAGALIPGTGGVRKLRWQAQGRGKRGGVRVIYYTRRPDSEIWMLTIYAKNVTEAIPFRILRQIREEIDA